MEKLNLTANQSDYAIFLPALSSFYATFVGKQRKTGNYVDPGRIPAHFTNGVESGNWLSSQGLFNYHWSLYSAGHADLNINNDSPKEYMVRDRDRSTSWLLGDSGGFQIAKGVWEADWKNPTCPRAQSRREQVVAWMDEYMDYGMMLDVPTWTFRDPKASKASGIESYQDAVTATHINAEFYMRNRKGNFKVLNVLQGGTHEESKNWYNEFKKYSDPKQYENYFEGWAMGGLNMCSIEVVLNRILDMIDDGLLEKQKWMHFLGTSKLEWSVLLTSIQRAVRKHCNPEFTISYDCASPFLATANGQVYNDIRINVDQKWSYTMKPGVDDKKFSSNTTPYGQVFVNEGCGDKFFDSPVTENLTVKDICIYADGDLNKVGKEGKTSWDSFSYFLLMAHNVWTHIYATQLANGKYDNNVQPPMFFPRRAHGVVQSKIHEIIDEVIGAAGTGRAREMVGEYHRYFEQTDGTRVSTKHKPIFEKLFTES